MSNAITEAVLSALDDLKVQWSPVGGESINEATRKAAKNLVYRALSAGQAQPHTDDLAVDRFAAAMKAKLAEKRAQGYHGWDDPEDCTIEHLSNLLVKHVGKGDPVDVGNFAMMIHQRGGRIE